MNLTINPLPCPFCLFPRPVKSKHGGFMVCPNCLAHGPCDPEVSAIDAWDTRHMENKLRSDAIAVTQQLERLKSAARDMLAARSSTSAVWAMNHLRETLQEISE